ncbi:MAG: hypothetical protein U0930_12495 [Pirellulales bacterium]
MTGKIGYSAQNFDQLFASKSAVGYISPNFAWNLLNYGRIKFNVEAEKAPSWHYATTTAPVIKAAQEAEDPASSLCAQSRSYARPNRSRRYTVFGAGKPDEEVARL